MGFLRRHFNRTWSFTREGRIIVLIAIGLGVAAINTGNNLLYLVFAILLSMIVLSGILSEMNIGRLSVSLKNLPEVAVGEVGFATVCLKNRRRMLQGLALQVRLDMQGAAKEASEGFIPLVRSGRSVDVNVRIQGVLRGPFTASAIHVYTSFPFSFFKKGIVYNIEGHSLVLPRPIPIDMTPIYALKQGQELPSSGLGRQGEFWGVREFRTGDNPKAIHYRLSARMNKPMVREFTAMGTPRLVLGIRNSGNHDHVETAISKTAFLVSALLDQGWVVRLADLDSSTDWLVHDIGIRKGLRFLSMVKNPSEKRTAAHDVDLWVD